VLGQGETRNQRPSFLPDGRHFLYSAVASGAAGSGGPLYLASLDSAERKSLLNADSANVLYTQGNLLFLRERTLMAQPFDVRRLVFTGESFPIAEQIQTTQANQPYGFFSASENGVLAYETVPAIEGSHLVWFDRTGKQIGVLGDPAAYSRLELSPDGKRASVRISDQASKGRYIWLYDVARGLRSRFTFDPADDLNSVWSPDSSRVVFSSRRKVFFDLYQKASSGAGSEEVLLEDNLDKFPMSWSPDGRFILYVSSGPSRGNDLFVLPLTGDRKPFPFLQTRFSESDGRFSPDGRWVAYSSNESGKNEVYVAPFPGPGGKWQISTVGGTEPAWNRNGRELFYRSGDKMMAVDIATQPGFSAGAPRTLFEGQYASAPFPTTNYDVLSDGQRSLMVKPSEQEAATTQINVVLNWFEELKQKVPTGKK
jgi:Tol biopolymer transport system component